MDNNPDKLYLWHIAQVAYLGRRGMQQQASSSVCVLAHNVHEARGRAIASCLEMWPIVDGWHGHATNTPNQIPEQMITTAYRYIDDNKD